MSTESLYEPKAEIPFRTAPYPSPREGRSGQGRSLLQTTAAALDSSSFKGALFAASLAVAAVYYVAVITIALLY